MAASWRPKVPFKKQLKHRFADPRYQPWRLEVLRRANFQCQHCQKPATKKGTGLDCHHIKSWTYFPGLRYDPNNGMALCRACHKKEHRRIAAARRR